VRRVHGEEDPNAEYLQPKMQKNQNSHAIPVRWLPTEATSTVKQAGEGIRTTPNHRSSTTKNTKDLERNGIRSGGGREESLTSLLTRRSQEGEPRVFYFERERRERESKVL